MRHSVAVGALTTVFSLSCGGGGVTLETRTTLPTDEVLLLAPRRLPWAYMEVGAEGVSYRLEPATLDALPPEERLRHASTFDKWVMGPSGGRFDAFADKAEYNAERSWKLERKPLRITAVAGGEPRAIPTEGRYATWGPDGRLYFGVGAKRPYQGISSVAPGEAEAEATVLFTGKASSVGWKSDGTPVVQVGRSLVAVKEGGNETVFETPGIIHSWKDIGTDGKLLVAHDLPGVTARCLTISGASTPLVCWDKDAIGMGAGVQSYSASPDGSRVAIAVSENDDCVRDEFANKTKCNSRVQLIDVASGTREDVVGLVFKPESLGDLDYSPRVFWLPAM